MSILSKVKNTIRGLPVLGPIAALVKSSLDRATFTTSRQYWERRYSKGRDSGLGSYGKFAKFKAEVINGFLSENQVASVIEYGCGDGNQITLIDYPKYLGFDISKSAVEICKGIFRRDDTKRFKLMDEYDNETAELTLSLDVIFHLVEDDVFERYMSLLFESSTRFVIIYSNDTDAQTFGQGPHMRHRKFTKWVAHNKPEWTLIRHIPNRYPMASYGYEGSFADFYFYEKA
jgi:hypothetical protein